MAYRLTNRQFDLLLKLRRKPRPLESLRRAAGTDEKGINGMMSEMSKLWYVIDDEKATEGLIQLNHIGESVAQAEHDRRFDRYYTRLMSLAALLVSIVAVIVSIVK